MALSDGSIRELKRELVHLEKNRLEIEARAQAIKAVLAPYLNEVVTSQRPPNGIRAVGVSRRRTKRGKNKRASLRAAVLTVVSQSPGLSTQNVAQELREKGMLVAGKTPLNQRVYHELYKMVQKGVLERQGGGYAVLKPGDRPSRSEALKQIG